MHGCCQGASKYCAAVIAGASFNAANILLCWCLSLGDGRACLQHLGSHLHVDLGPAAFVKG
eukprot:1505691-Amphidinium_carterae.2